MALHLESGLWIDSQDARQELDRRHTAGVLTDATADRIARFVENGFVSFPLEVDRGVLERLADSYDSLWGERTTRLAHACAGPPKRFSAASETSERRPGYRIHDVHSELAEALALYLHPDIHGFAKAVFDEEVVAIQSLLFEYGSEQMIHRDPITVPTSKPLHLLAAWIALEDVTHDCGPLLYVPGSHRLPYYEFHPGQYMFDESTMGADEIRRGLEFYESELRDRGLVVEQHWPRKGEVLLWHASLFHGGAPVEDPSKTRKSFVVHLSSRSSYLERSITIQDDDDFGASKPVVWWTTELIESNGCAGFQNPLLGDK